MSQNNITVIAEMANAHEGDVSAAKNIVDAVAGHTDAIKFQAFTAEELLLPSHPDYETFAQLEMSVNEWEELISYAQDSNLNVFADVFGFDSLELMAANDVDGYKIHNADISNLELIDRAGETGHEIFLSAGGSTWIELASALERLDDTQTTLMFGYQNYPTAINDSDLYRIQALSEKFDVPVGYASHAPGESRLATTVPQLAVAAGASAIEVHVTLDRSTSGTDHFSALEPAEFETMVEGVQLAQKVVGERSLSLSESELEYRRQHKKWLVTTEEVQRGDTFTVDCVGYKRLADPPVDKNISKETVLGKKATKDITVGKPLTYEHMETKVVATLACRAESERLYGKPLQLVGGEPILRHLIERLRTVRRIDEIVLAIADTPSKEAFIDFAVQEDLEYVIGSEENVLGRLIKAGNHADADIAVRVTTENPYIYCDNLDELIEKHQKNNNDLTLTRDLPFGTTVEVVSFRALQTANNHGEDRHRSELCTLFIVENPDSFEIHAETPPKMFQRPDIRLSVDNPEDLIVVREVWENIATSGQIVPLENIIEYLDSNPAVGELNAELPDGTTEEIKRVRPFMYGDGVSQ